MYSINNLNQIYLNWYKQQDTDHYLKENINNYKQKATKNIKIIIINEEIVGQIYRTNRISWENKYY